MAVPPLPVPELNETLTKYLQTIEPFLRPEDYLETKNIVERFGSGFGRTLQERLKARAETCLGLNYVHENEVEEKPRDVRATKPTRNNWLIDWFREPVVLNVSFFFVFPRDQKRRDPIVRAAALLFHAHQFKQLIANGQLSAETSRTGPLCMKQYHFLMNTCRVPHETSDIFKVYDPSKRRIFELFGNRSVKNALWVDQLRQLDKICIVAKENPAEVGVGALTADGRDDWAKNYALLSSVSLKNKTHLETIQSASLVLCLDTASPLTGEELASKCWHGDGLNRWFDKTVQIIVFQNGRAGFLGEHSMVDAMTPTRLCDYILEKTLKSEGSENFHELGPLPDPEMLQFTLPPQIDLLKPVAAVERAVAAHDIQTLHFTSYGKGLIKNYGLSPDSFVQMAIQLAYYKMMGTCASTYETCGMRGWEWGRTETCRSVSLASLNFVREMEDAGDGKEMEKAKAAREAIVTHAKYMAECGQGKGIDRHFLGLRLCLKEGEALPEIFIDPAYNLSCHWTLSTSQIASEYFEGYGWGEVVPDGFGIAYMVREDFFRFNIAGQIGDQVPDLELAGGDTSEAFHDDYFVKHYKQQRVKWIKSCIQESLEDMRHVFDYEIKQKAKVPVQTTETADKPVAVERVSSPPEVSSSLLRDRSNTATKSLRDVKLNAAAPFGYSLAYPRRDLSENIYSQPLNDDLSGVIGEDVGALEFEFGWGQSKSKKLKRRPKSFNSSSDPVSPTFTQNSFDSSSDHMTETSKSSESAFSLEGSSSSDPYSARKKLLKFIKKLSITPLTSEVLKTSKENLTEDQ